MNRDDAVLLIPGFFGFDGFGGATTPRIEYFRGVKDALVLAGIPRERIHVHRPPPTGSLAERTASLHDRVCDLLARTGSESVARLHLVGHSTGGVDARLYAHAKYRWTGGPDVGSPDRESRRTKLGRVIAVSAPFRGSPIAERLALGHGALLTVLYAISVLGKTPGLQYLAVFRPVLRTAWRVIQDQHVPDGEVLGFFAGLEGDTVTEIRQFFGRLGADRQLLYDLRLEQMTALNGPLADGDDPGRVKSYATVAPPPSVDLSRPQYLAFEAIYRFVHHATSAVEYPAPAWLNDRAPWIEEPGKHARAHKRLLQDRSPNDGIVPALSQTLDGPPDGVVLADHLDIIGHYGASGNGTVVFESGSKFGRERFELFWRGVAADLA